MFEVCRSHVFQVTVREALFDGYHDPLIDLVCRRQILEQLCKALSIPQRIGFFYKQNNTDDGLYQVSTGLNEPWNIGQVRSHLILIDIWDI
ncbi:unnamed protein product [Cylicostephanus goldi]|uniref:Uncharacterized protein n=1 Tax=Cylicostephanus goldi TaxID=71465 RepID=A0A3P7R5K0_CYLGO|nr:unnamed protein product [Cylicostephanus goldi]